MKNRDDKRRGHYLVCPDLGPIYTKDNDALTRLLCYLLRHIDEIIAVPPDVSFEVISIRWHHFGEAYPCIGIPDHEEVKRGKEVDDFSYLVADAIEKYVQRIGLANLKELSANEPLTWQEVVQHQ